MTSFDVKRWLGQVRLREAIMTSFEVNRWLGQVRLREAIKTSFDVENGQVRSD